MAIILSVLGAICFGVALVTGRVGLARTYLTGKGIAWFLYAALTIAAVSTVVPIGWSLPDEKLSPRVLTGASITVAAVVYLVSTSSG